MQPNTQRNLTIIPYNQVEACRREGPIPEVQGTLMVLMAYCRKLGEVTEYGIQNTCILPLLLKEKTNLLSHQDPEIIINVANYKYMKEVKSQQKNYSAACKPIFESCRSFSGNNDWWAYTGCYKNILLVYGIQPSTQRELPRPSFVVVEACRRERSIVELQTSCSLLKSYWS